MNNARARTLLFSQMDSTCRACGASLLDSKARRPLKDLPKLLGRLTKTSFPVTQMSLLHAAVISNQLLQQPCRLLAIAIKRNVPLHVHLDGHAALSGSCAVSNCIPTPFPAFLWREISVIILGHFSRLLFSWVHLIFCSSGYIYTFATFMVLVFLYVATFLSLSIFKQEVELGLGGVVVGRNGVSI